MANEKAPTPAKPAEPTAPADPSKKKSTLKMALMAVIVLALEGGTVALTVVLSGGPKRVIAEVPAATSPAASEKDVEVKLIDAKLPNSKSGRLYMYDLQVVATTPESNKARLTELFGEREAEIRDHIRAIIASSDGESLQEPGLETLRRQIAYQLEQDLGKDQIKEVLLPRCTPIRAEY